MNLYTHDVVLTCSGKEAIDVLEQDSYFDLIICDLMMSNLSGMELYEWLQQTYPYLTERFVIITGVAFTPRAKEFLQNVSNTRIEKPFRCEELVELVNEMVSIGRHVC